MSIKGSGCSKRRVWYMLLSTRRCRGLGDEPRTFRPAYEKWIVLFSFPIPVPPVPGDPVTKSIPIAIAA